MTELSPQAQAVKDAVLALYSNEKVHKFGWQLDAPTVAAALRAAAKNCPPQVIRDRLWIRVEDLFAIANELEAR